jgi:hypothetical protein
MASIEMITVSIDFTLLRAVRRELECSDTPDLVHASDRLLRTRVVWRSMASVTMAGDGGSELANERGERAGVRAVATTVDEGVLSVSSSVLSLTH